MSRRLFPGRPALASLTAALLISVASLVAAQPGLPKAGSGVTVPGVGATGNSKSAPNPKSKVTKPNPALHSGQSIHEIRKETLLYGINSQILSLLGTLTQEKDSSLNTEVGQVCEQTTDPQVRQAALDFLASMKDWKLTKVAKQAIEHRIQSGDTANDKVVVSAIRYLEGAKDKAALPLITKLVTDQSPAVAYEAISSIGTLGGSAEATTLLQDLKDPGFDAKLKPQIVLALGTLKSKAAVPELTKLLSNQDQSSIMREYACAALGEIGDPASLPAIQRAFASSDTYLRAYAVSALVGFNEPKVDSLLIEALKDSFWRVRVNAAKSLGKKKVSSALPILEYKARYDPELVVKRAALTAIGEIGGPKAISFLRTVFENKLANQALRAIAVDDLVAQDLDGSFPMFDRYIQSEWSQPASHLFYQVCDRLSQAKNPKLEPLFERFLGSPNLNIQIYGLRGIGNNGFKTLLGKVKPFDNPKRNTSVRAAAESAIRHLK